MSQTSTSTVRPVSGLYWTAYLVASASALISLGFAIAGLVSHGSDPFALYAASRSIALALAVLSLGLWRSKHAMVLLAVTMAIVQALDTIIGMIAADPAKTYGPGALAIIGLITAIVLQRRG